MKTVFINPGHSKNCNPDPGAVGNGYKEAILAHEISVMLSAELAGFGVIVDSYQQCEGTTANAQLNQVPKVANKANSDIFVSIHLNSGPSAASGTETLYSKGSIEGKKLATLVNEELIRPINGRAFKNRGPKEDSRGLLVLKATKMPAILIEVGFISNKEEADFIATHITDIAKAISRGICKYLGIEHKVNKRTPHYIELKPVENRLDSYDCYIDSQLKLQGNKLSTCLTWLNENYIE